MRPFSNYRGRGLAQLRDACRAALALPEEIIRDTMGSMKRRAVQADASKSLWAKND